MLTRTIIARSHAQHRAAHAEELLLQDIDDDDLPLETDTISKDGVEQAKSGADL